MHVLVSQDGAIGGVIKVTCFNNRSLLLSLSPVRVTLHDVWANCAFVWDVSTIVMGP